MTVLSSVFMPRDPSSFGITNHVLIEAVEELVDLLAILRVFHFSGAEIIAGKEGLGVRNIREPFEEEGGIESFEDEAHRGDFFGVERGVEVEIFFGENDKVGAPEDFKCALGFFFEGGSHDDLSGRNSRAVGGLEIELNAAEADRIVADAHVFKDGFDMAFEDEEVFVDFGGCFVGFIGDLFAGLYGFIAPLAGDFRANPKCVGTR